MNYGDVADTKAMRDEVKRCTDYVSNLGCQIAELKEELKNSKREL